MKYVIFILLMFGTAILVLATGLALPTVVALLILVSAVSADFYTTWACMQKQGTEGNPVMALMFRKMGLRKAFGVMSIIWIIFIMFRWLPQTTNIQTAIAFAYWLVPLNTTMVLLRLKKSCPAS